MDLRTAPALPAAAAFVAGVCLALHLTIASVPLAIALAGLGVGLGVGCARRPGRWLAALAGGLAWGIVAAPLPPGSTIDAARPVEAVARVSRHWVRSRGGWWGTLEVSSVRQGTRVAVGSFAVSASLPGREVPPGLGNRVRIRGYLSPPLRYADGVPAKEGRWRLRIKSRRLLQVVGRPPLPLRLASRLRRRVTEAYGAQPATPGTALARAFVLGDASHLEPRLVRALRRSGLAHLLAVSGLHLGLVAAGVLLLASPLPRGVRLASVVAAVAVYTALVGARPSLVRAGIMAGAAVVSLLLDRPPAPANTLALAVAGMAFATPGAVLETGFRLTVSATAGLLLLAPPLAERWRRVRRCPRALAVSLAATVAAQLATLPWSLPAFHGVAPLAPVWNLLAVPWTALSLAASLLWSVAAVAAPAAARGLVPLLDALAAPYSWLARVPAGPWWWIPWVVGEPTAWALAAGLALLLLGTPSRRAVLVLAVLAVLVILSGGVGSGGVLVAHGSPAALPELDVVDVGQGDAILLRDGPHALLVDGGGRWGGGLGARVLVPALARLGVGHLEAVVMTHPDRDHCAGLVEAASYLPVGEVWASPGWRKAGCFGELAALPGVPLRRLRAGDAGELGRWRWRVLYPATVDLAAASLPDNERSLVLLAATAGHRVLLTGDIGATAERRLVRRYPDLRADLLKVAHHGSRHSTTARFLDAVSPRLALISVGRRNPYGHPARSTLRRFAVRHVLVLRTDRDGLIRVRFDAAGRTHLSLPGSPRGAGPP